jgi:hypothetical protein
MMAWADMSMVLRYAHLAPGYVTGYAGNSFLQNSHSTESCGTKLTANPMKMGWLMGLEPTITGITIHPEN